MTFMCLRDKTFPDKTSFAFLEDVKDKFFERIPETEYLTAIPNGLNAKFRDTLKNRMEYFRKNPQDIDKLSLLRQTLNDSKNEILQTDDILNSRSEKINLIVDKAEHIKTESRSYYEWVCLYIYNDRVRKLKHIQNGEK